MCQFMQMIAGAASGVMQGMLQNAQNDAQYTVQSAQTDAANLLSQDQADNSNALRDAGNEFAAAQASLANTQRSIGNKQRADAIGSQWNSTVTTQGRVLDSMVRGNVEQQISAAQTLGAINADNAARGVGGTSADIMRMTMKQRNARLVTGQQTRMQQTSFDQLIQQSGLRSALLNSQDYGETVANLNYQAAIPQTYIKPAKMPDLTLGQMALMGVAGGGGFQQFRQGNNGSGSTVGYSGSGGVGDSGNYSSSSILSGVDSFQGNNSGWSAGQSGTSGNDSWNLGGSDSSSSGGSFNFTLSGDV
ncbi:hypothetical protein [Paraburkholderia hospita]|uniref:hypothetical protein n=1 Tax=Paraburkholderia hospita TaxID=169430 RepID=UPI003ECD64DD